MRDNALEVVSIAANINVLEKTVSISVSVYHCRTLTSSGLTTLLESNYPPWKQSCSL